MKRTSLLFRQVFACLLCALCMMTALAFAPSSQATVLGTTIAQAASSDGQAKAAYKKRLKKVIKNDKYGDGAYYKFADVYGSSTVEMLSVTREVGGSGSMLRIYTYKSGKVKLIGKIGFYGDQSYAFYKKSKGFVMYCAGHGGEHYDYYKMSNGKYKLIARRARVSKAGGSTYTAPWTYYTANSEITKASFNKRIKSITKGTKTKLAPSWKWSWTSG